jgi:hypothetical protein
MLSPTNNQFHTGRKRHAVSSVAQVLSGFRRRGVTLASRPRRPRHRRKRTDQDRLPAGADRPSSSTGVGINRGTSSRRRDQQCGGINGRKIELISRDTQSDPTKAVNAVAELTQRQKVAMILGPVNSGEGAGGDAADRARQGADAASRAGSTS